MAASPIILSVVTESHPGREKEVGALFGALLEPTRAEAGCVAYELSTLNDEPGTFLFYEKFADQAALDAHVASPHFQKFLKDREANDPIAKQTVMRWSAFTK